MRSGSGAVLHRPNWSPPPGCRVRIGRKRGTTLLDFKPLGSPSQPADLGWANMDEESVLAYLDAVGDKLPIYQQSGLAPPLYGVALALGQILQRTGLPTGAIHSLQEFDTLQPVVLGSSLRTLACLERQRERGGLRFLTFRASMEDPDGAPALALRTTLLVPGAHGDQPAGDGAAPSQADGSGQEPSTAAGLAAVTREITQAQLSDYSRVSGDYNPLHLDSDFAAGTRFCGIVAHGMLTLAYINEMLATSLGVGWLSSGSIKVRFKGAAYVGDQLETWGRASRTDGDVRTFAVGVRNSSTGSDLIAGTATSRKN